MLIPAHVEKLSLSALSNTDRSFTEVSSQIAWQAEGGPATQMQQAFPLNCQGQNVDSKCVKELSIPIRETHTSHLANRALGAVWFAAAFVIAYFAYLWKSVHEASVKVSIPIDVADHIESVKQSSTIAWLTESGKPPITFTASDDQLVTSTAAQEAVPTNYGVDIKDGNVEVTWPPSLTDGMTDSDTVPQSCKDGSDSCSRDWATELLKKTGKHFYSISQDLSFYLNGKIDQIVRSEQYTIFVVAALGIRWLMTINEWAQTGFISFQSRQDWLLVTIICLALQIFQRAWINDRNYISRFFHLGRMKIPLVNDDGMDIDGHFEDIPSDLTWSWGDQRLPIVPQDHDGSFSMRFDLTYEENTNGKPHGHRFEWSLYLGTNPFQSDPIQTGGHSGWTSVQVDRGRLFVLAPPQLHHDFDLMQFVFVDWTGKALRRTISDSAGKDQETPKWVCEENKFLPRPVTKSLICRFNLNPIVPDKRFRVRITQTARGTSKDVTLKAELYTRMYEEFLAENQVTYKDNKAHVFDINMWDPKDKNSPAYRFDVPLQKDSKRVRVTVKDGMNLDGGTIVVAHVSQAFLPSDAGLLLTDQAAMKTWYSCGDDCRERSFDLAISDNGLP